MKPRWCRAAALVAALWTLTVAAQMQVEVIPLRHRFPEEIIPVLQPLLVPGGSISGMNNQLVVKTTAENLAQIQAVLDGVDRALRRLRITVRRDAGHGAERGRQSLSGALDAGAVTVRQPERPGGRGVTLGAGDRDDRLRVQAAAHGVERTEYGTWTVQAVEGQPAFIRTGQAVPVHEPVVYATGGGPVVQDTVTYRDADSGFWVVPRLSGETVTLLITPQTTGVSHGTTPVFDVERARTTVNGRLGEWIAIGGVGGAARRERREIGSHDVSERAARTTFEVRVEEMP
jgi:hypothetical protein